LEAAEEEATLVVPLQVARYGVVIHHLDEVVTTRKGTMATSFEVVGRAMSSTACAWRQQRRRRSEAVALDLTERGVVDHCLDTAMEGNGTIVVPAFHRLI
jgi:hypothetical protein